MATVSGCKEIVTKRLIFHMARFLFVPPDLLPTCNINKMSYTKVEEKYLSQDTVLKAL